MRYKITPLIAILALAFLAGLTNRAFAQAYEKQHASMLILPGNGTDVAHTLTIIAPLLSGSSTLTLPGSNVQGILTNDGSGVLLWTALGTSNIAPGANNTFLVTNASGSTAWNGLSIDATLVGNGIGSALGLNLTKANTWTAAQTIAPTGDSVGLVVKGTSATSPTSDIIDVQNSGGTTTYLKVDKNGLTTLNNGLTVSGNIDVNGKWATEEDSVTVIGGATNNNVSSGSRSRLSIGLSGTPATTTITGFAGGSNGSLLNIMNLTGQIVIFANESPASASGNRLRTRTGAAIALPTQQTVTFTWDQDFSEWILQGVGGVATVTTGGTGLTTLTQNGILFGNGTSPIGATSAAANSILVTDGSNNPSLSQTLPSAVLPSITSLTGMTGAITYPTALTFDGTSGRTMSMARNAGTIQGQGLTIQAGAPASLASANNLSGGDLTLSSGVSEGTGLSNIFFQTPVAGSIGNADNTPVTRVTLNSSQLNLSTGVELDQNGTQRISSSGVGNFSSLTLGSPLSLSNGGTNASLTASNGGIFYSTASAGAILAGTATANQILLSGSSAAPAWSSATYPVSTTVNQLLYSSSANTIAGLSTANNGVLITSSGGVPSISSTLPTAVQGNITSTGTITSGTWHAGTIAIANGGTGQTTAPAALTALVPDSTNHTLQFLQVQAGGGYSWAPPSAGPGVVTSVNISGGTSGLTATGGPITTSGTITLGGTLAIANGGTGQSTKNAAFNALAPDSTNASGKVLAVQAGGGYAWTSVGTGNGSVTSVSGSGGTTGLTFTGGPISTNGTLTLGGTLAVANGGTGQASALTPGGVVYGSSSTAMGTSAVGTSGQLLISGGAGAPSFTSSVSGLTITNSSIGTTSPSTGVFTSVTTPTVYGGNVAGSSLNLQSTSSGSPSADYIAFTSGGVERARLLSNGNFGIGSSSPTTTLYLQGTLAIPDDTTTITGNTTNNNVSPGSTSLLHIGLTGTAGPSTITGFTGSIESRLLTIINLTGQNLTLANNSVGSALGGRIFTRTGGDITLPQGGVAQLRVDEELGGWAVEFIGGANNLSTGGTGVTSLTQNGVLFGNGTSPIQATSAAANSVLVTNGSNVPSLSQTLPAAVQANITSLTGMTGAITYPTALTFDGTAARTMSLARNTGSATGQGLTIQAGAPASLSATQNLAGGNLTLSSGISEGSGLSSIFFQTAAAGGIGNTDNTPATRLTLDATNLNLGSGINLQTNGTTRISSTGAGTLASLTLGSALTVANGGTGQTSFTNGQLLIGNTTGNTLTPATLTAGSGISVTNGNGTITIGNTGFSSPMTTFGDLVYENATPAATRLAGTTSATKQFLTQTGNGTISAAPAWGTIAVGDVPTLNQSTTGTAANATNVTTTSVSTAGTYYPLFVSSSSNGNQAADLGTGLTFNPSTNTLSTTTFSGALSGNATNVTGIVALANGGTGVTNASGVAQNAFFAGPSSGGSGAASFRTLVASDIPSLSGAYLPLAGGTMSGNIAMGGNNITGAGAITSSSHVLTGTLHNGTLQEIATLGQATTYTIPDPGAATATIALTTSNITGTSANVTGIVALANGGTGVTNASGVAQNTVFAGPTSVVTGAASFRALVPGDVPTLNQNTTGTAANVTGIVALANGGTGVTNASGVAQNAFFGGPSGAAGAASFRAIVASDIPTLNQNTTGTSANVTGTVAVANGGTGASTATANTIFAGPASGIAAAPAFRAIVASDLPSLSGTYLPLAGGTMSGAIAMGGNNITGGGTMTGTIHNATTGFEINGVAASGNYLRGNGTNFVSSAIQLADIPSLSGTYLALAGGTMSGSIAMGGGNISGGGTITGTAITGSSLVLKGTSFNGTVQELAGLGQATTYTIPDPGAATATIALTTSNITGTSSNVTGTVAVVNGGTGQTTYTNGQLLIGNTTGNTLTPATLTAGTGISITNGSGSITIANTGFTSPMTTLGDITYENATPAAARLAGTISATKQFLTQTGNGTVSAAPAWGTIAAGDIPMLNQNTTGTAANVTGIVALANGGTGVTNASGVAQNAFFAGPSGAAGAASFRAIVASDIPTLNQNTTGTSANVTGTVAVANGGTGASTATANTIFAGPASGAAAAPSFRAIVASDIPSLSGTYLPLAGGNMSGAIAMGGNNITGGGAITGTIHNATTGFQINGIAASGNYLRGNGTNFVSSTIQAADVPTLNQNTTGTASNVTGVVAVANGGTGTGTAFTQGSIPFVGVGGVYSQDNSNLLWDESNKTFVLGGGTELPHAILSATGYVDDYLQITSQNLSGGSSASTDFIATADNGSDSTHYIDFGIDGSGYSDPSYSDTKANDGYLYVAGGKLVMGTATADSLVLQTGGNLLSNQRFSINGTGTITFTNYGAGALFTNSTGVVSAGTLSIANGGTGQTTASGTFSALSPLTTLGDIIYENSTPAAARLPGNTTATKQFLTQTGNGTISSSPAWGTIAAGDVPTLNQNTTGTASNVTGIVALANGGTGVTNASGVAKSAFFGGPSALAGGASFRALVAADIPTLNQNTTGTAANVTGTVAVANGGTGVSTATANTIFAGPASGVAAAPAFRAIVASDIPTLNQNTTGTASNVTGTVAVANGGTGQTSYTNGQLLIGNTTGNTLTPSTLTAGTGISITNGTGSITIANTGFTSPMTTLGDITYENGTPAATRLPGTTSATKQFLTQTGNGTISAAPAWGTIAVGDVPTLNQNTTGTATNATNIATTAVSTASTYYPLFVSSSSNGNQAADLGTGLTFNPSTNTLSTTTFSGALTGNATNVTGIVALANGGTGVTNASGVAQNAFFGGPSGASGAASFRTLVASDIPSLSGSYLPLAGGTMSGNIAMGGNNISGAGAITSSSHVLTGTLHNGTLQEIATLGQATTYTIPDPGAATATIALTTSNITGTSANVTGIVALANGGTGVTNASGVAQNAVFAGPTSGVSGAASFRALAASDIPTLNQNTTGTAANVTGTVAVANGGTGVSTATANTIFAGPASGVAAAPAFRAIVASDIPTLNQNTTGTASNVTGTVAVANGGTGQTSYTNGQLLIGNTTGNTLTPSTLTAGTGISITNGTGSITIANTGFTSPMTTLGDITYENGTPAATRLPGTTSATKQFLTQTGNGTISAAPAWGTIAVGDVPTLNQNTTGTATNATNIATTAVSTASTYYPLFVSSSSNGNQAADLGTGLTFNPSTNTLSTTTFSGALTGNATNVTGIVALANGGTGVTNASGVAQNAFFGGPSGASGAASFRTLVASDIPSLSGSYLPLAGGTMSGNIAMGGNNISGAGAITSSSHVLTGTLHNGTLQEIATLGQATTYTIPDPGAATATIALTSSNITGTSANVTGIVALANGGTGVTNASGVAQNAVFAGPTSGVSGAASFRALAASDIPTLNQNTTGTAANVTGTVAVANGGTGVSTATANTIFAGPASGVAAAPAFRAIVASDIPTLNQNTTGTAANVTGTVAVANGGTGQTSYTNGQLLIGNMTGNTLTPSTLTAGTGISITNGTGSITIANTGFTSPMTTLGDITYENGTPAATRLPGTTSATKQFLTQTGNGTISAAPAWGTIAVGDVPTLNQNTTGTATNATNIATTAVSTASTYYPLFVSSSSNGNQAADLGTGLTFNPSTNTLSTTTFSGALTGNATNVTGIVALANGGTGVTNASGVAQNAFFGGPSGASGAASFRTLVASDIPSLSGSYLPLAGGTMSGNIAMGGNNISGAGAITSSSHVLTGTLHNGTLQEIATLGQATTYTIPDPGAATATIALTTSNITGTSANVTGIVALANGGTGVTNASGVAQNTVFAGPTSGVSGAASFRALAASDIPTLNQNTTGTAANVTGTVALANGGTGVTNASGVAQNAFFGGPSGTAGAASFRTIVAGDIPTLNQNTTGTAANVTGTVAVANGGTGVSTATANTIFAGPASGVAAAPSFRTIVAADIPSLSGTYLPLAGGTMSGAIAMGGNNITGGGTMTGTIHNATTGFEINGLAASGNYLRGNGTNFVSSAIQLADIPSLSGTYLALAGGTMSGAIAMGGNNISGGGTITGTAITGTSLVLKGTSFNGTMQELAGLGQATTYTLPDPGAATATIALTSSNITGTSANVTGIVALANGGTGVTNASGVAQNAVFAGPTSGVSGAASFRTLVASDIPSLSGSYLPLAGGTMTGSIAMGGNNITAGGTISATTLSGTVINGTTITGTTITGSSHVLTGTLHNGTLQELAALGQATTYTLPDPAAATATIALTSSNITGTSANVTGTVAVANGGTGQTSYTNGQLLIGNTTGNTLIPATLTAGTGISITNGGGSITIANTGLANPMTTSGDMIYENSTPAITRFAGNTTATKDYMSMTSGVPSWGTIAAGDIPTLNQSTTGTAANVTGIVLGANGGTGVANSGKTITLGGNVSTSGALTTSGAFGLTLTTTALTSVTLPTSGLLMANPMTTLGDVIYGGASGTATRIAGNITSTKQFLTQTGNGTISAAPAWGAIAAADIPTLNQNTTGTAANATDIATTTVSNNATYYPLFVASASNGNQAANMDASGISYNPSTNALTTSTQNLTGTTNQIVLGTTNTTTLSATAPASSVTYTIPDAGGAGNVMITSGGGLERTDFVTSTMTSTSTTQATTTLSFNIGANENWSYEMYLQIENTTGGAGTGLIFQIAPPSAAVVEAHIETGLQTTSITQLTEVDVQRLAATGNVTTGTMFISDNNAGADGWVKIDGMVFNSTTGGTVTLNWASSASGKTITLRKGSYLIARKM